MAATYQWEWERGPASSPFTVKIPNGSTALGITYSPVLVSSNALGVPTQGAELLGVAVPNAAANEDNIPVIVGADNVFRVQVKAGTNLNVTDPVQVEADGSVDALVATNACVGTVVDYNPAAGGIAHVKAIFNALNGSGVNDAATKMPLAGGTFTGDIAMTGGKNATLGAASNVILDTVTGNKIGTATAQKLGFWNATPVIQQASGDQAAVTMGSANSAIGNLTSSATTTQAEFNALRDACETLADDARAINVLLTAIRTALVNTGNIKGAA